MSEFSDAIDLGPCCTCGTRSGVRNIVMLEQLAPLPGTGWGCAVCGLPADGAIAVVCDACLEQPITHACVGYADRGLRVPLTQLQGTRFAHSEAAHLAQGEGQLFPEVA